MKTFHWYIFLSFYLSIPSVMWHNCQRVFSLSCISGRHAERFDCLITSLILIPVNNGRRHCTLAWWQSCKVSNRTYSETEKRKIYAIKQIKVCEEYRDMLLRPRLVGQEPWLRWIGRSPDVPDKSIAHLSTWRKHSIGSIYKLLNYNIDGKMYKSIKALLPHAISRIELNRSLRSEWFENICGVRQGDVYFIHQRLSCTLKIIWSNNRPQRCAHKFLVIRRSFCDSSGNGESVTKLTKLCL